MRLSDTALLKLVQRARWLRTLDLRGCKKLSPDGLAAALAPPLLPVLHHLTLSSCPAATPEVLSKLGVLRPTLRFVN